MSPEESVSVDWVANQEECITVENDVFKEDQDDVCDEKKEKQLHGNCDDRIKVYKKGSRSGKKVDNLCRKVYELKKKLVKQREVRKSETEQSRGKDKRKRKRRQKLDKAYKPPNYIRKCVVKSNCNCITKYTKYVIDLV